MQPVAELVELVGIQVPVEIKSHEHQLVSRLAGDMAGQLVDEEPWQRHLPALVALRRAPMLGATDEGYRLGDDRPAAKEVEASDSQCRHLAEPQAAISPNRRPAGEEQHDEAVWPARVGEHADLVVRE